VLDNALIHVGSKLWDFAMAIFETVGINLCFLPIYLPELNAAEFVFNLVKQQVK
jgi:transposase